MNKHLAELNIGRLRAPLDHPSMKEFSDFLDPVNKLAEESEGFIWRFTDDEGTPSSYLQTPFSSQDILVNFSVWKDLESLKRFTFHTVHTYFLRNRASWFHRMQSHHLVLWWIDAGTIPTLKEAKNRLEYLESNGPSPFAFTFKNPFRKSSI